MSGMGKGFDRWKSRSLGRSFDRSVAQSFGRSVDRSLPGCVLVVSRLVLCMIQIRRRLASVASCSALAPIVDCLSGVASCSGCDSDAMRVAPRQHSTHCVFVCATVLVLWVLVVYDSWNGWCCGCCRCWCCCLCCCYCLPMRLSLCNRSPGLIVNLSVRRGSYKSGVIETLAIF